MYYEEIFIERTLGGTIGWCKRLTYHWQRHIRTVNDIVFMWSEAVGSYKWSLRLLYYKVMLPWLQKSQVLQLRRLFHTVGVMSRSRGEHHKYSKRWRNANS